MNTDAFDEWFEYHQAAFPGLAEWLGKLHESARPILVRSWRKALHYAELDDAKEATDRMVAGDVRKPYSYEDHVSVIADAARGIKSSRRASSPPASRYYDGQKAVVCQACQDTGYVRCWEEGTVRAWLSGKDIRPCKTVVLCVCDAGNYRERIGHQGRECSRYNDREWLAIGQTDIGMDLDAEQDRDRMVAFVERGAERMPNYEPAFDGRAAATGDF